MSLEITLMFYNIFSANDHDRPRSSVQCFIKIGLGKDIELLVLGVSEKIGIAPIFGIPYAAHVLYSRGPGQTRPTCWRPIFDLLAYKAHGSILITTSYLVFDHFFFDC